jgi:ABC-type branched-subunit amino acid transport system ATPase component
MQLGNTIAAGTMAEMRQHPEVIDAYLGEVDV